MWYLRYDLIFLYHYLRKHMDAIFIKNPYFKYCKSANPNEKNIKHLPTHTHQTPTSHTGNTFMHTHIHTQQLKTRSGGQILNLKKSPMNEMICKVPYKGMSRRFSCVTKVILPWKPFLGPRHPFSCWSAKYETYTPQPPGLIIK